MAIDKHASSYPPGFNKTAPNAGFGVEKTADFSTTDPYTQYADATEADQIFTLFMRDVHIQTIRTNFVGYGSERIVSIYTYQTVQASNFLINSDSIFSCLYVS